MRSNSQSTELFISTLNKTLRENNVRNPLSIIFLISYEEKTHFMVNNFLRDSNSVMRENKAGRQQPTPGIVITYCLSPSGLCHWL